MHEFDDYTDDLTEDMDDLTDDWSAFDDDLSDGEDVRTEAEKAADYAREKGFPKAADYIESHYDGGDFDPDLPIRIHTRNEQLEGDTSPNGVPFERRQAELTEGLVLEGVFPDFDSRHDVDLGSEGTDMSLHRQFSACKADFQDHMYDSPDKLEGMTFGDLFRMDEPTGYAPDGWTWHHNEVTGRFELVRTEDHRRAGHTGGNAVW